MNPIRKPLSLPLVNFQYTIPKLRYSSIEHPSIRCKLRFNRKVAFLSGCPRFSTDKIFYLRSGQSELNKTKKEKEQEATPIPRKVNETNLMDAKDRLQLLPKRFIEHKPIPDMTNKFKPVFQPLPQPKILLTRFSYKDTRHLETINKPINFQDILKDQYVNKIAVV